MSSVLSILKELGAWIDRLLERDNKHSEQLEEASIAFRKVVTETQVYLGDKLISGRPSRERETRLAELWSEAARLTRHFSPQVSEACYQLSVYWALPVESDRKDDKTLLAEIKSVYQAAGKVDLKHIL